MNDNATPCFAATTPARAGTGTSPTRHDAAHNRSLGTLGETVAAEYLTGCGYLLLDRNWRRGRDGELDLIALDGTTVVAVEVKARRGTAYGHPLEAITVAKARRLRRLLHAWVRENRPDRALLRVDAMGVLLRPGERPDISHLQGIA